MLLNSPCGFYHLGILGESVFILFSWTWKKLSTVAGVRALEQNIFGLKFYFCICVTLDTLLYLSDPLFLYLEM